MRPGTSNCTVSGLQFWPLDPRPEEVDIGDIAHALSNVCRYGGHVREFYSVAEHSVRVAHFLADNIVGEDAKGRETIRRLTLTGLLHDAGEAYIGDMTRPLKRCAGMEEFARIEGRIYTVIAQKYGCMDPLPPAVALADDVLLVTEVRDLHPALHARPDCLRAYADVTPLPEMIFPWPPQYAKRLFMEMFRKLGGAS